jgi:hypothetical protein
MGAVANVFRTESIEGMRKIFAELREVLDVLRNPLFRETLSQRAFRDLSSNIQALVGSEGFPEMCRLSEDAALRTFCEFDGAGEGASEEAIAERFTKNLVWGLAERRCLSAVRDGIMEMSGRSNQAQLRWEAELNNAISEPCASLSKSLLGEDRSVAVRAPRRLFKPAPMTVEALNQPLPVLG